MFLNEFCVSVFEQFKVDVENAKAEVFGLTKNAKNDAKTVASALAHGSKGQADKDVNG